MLGPMPSDNEVRPGTLGQDYGDVLWQPGPEVIERARITAYQRWLGAERGVVLGGGTGTDTYTDLHHWSVTEPGPFWDSLWDYFGVASGRSSAGELRDAGADMVLDDLADTGAVVATVDRLTVPIRS